ncbi:MAG: YrdB family protein [Sphingobacteriaceae bacterium]|nr:YrdB family protein [Sphingobacteriaceae bacterium]
MGSHALNLALRFILELTALFAMGYWGYKQSDQWYRFIFAFALPLAFAIVWGVFNVPQDPSRSGNAPVVVSGFVRLLIELFIFTFAALLIYKSGFAKYSIVFGIIVLFHYTLSYDRILWLIKK